MKEFLMKRYFGSARVSLMVLILGASVSAHADIWGDIGESYRKAVDGASDVLTLGEHGRRRDREWAENQARLDEERAAAATRERQARIVSIKEQQRILRQAVKNWTQLEKLIAPVIQWQDAVTNLMRQITENDIRINVDLTTASEEERARARDADVVVQILSRISKLNATPSTDSAANQETVRTIEASISMLKDIADERSQSISELIEDSIQHSTRSHEAIRKITEDLVDQRLRLSQISQYVANIKREYVAQSRALASERAQIDPSSRGYGVRIPETPPRLNLPMHNCRPGPSPYNPFSEEYKRNPPPMVCDAPTRPSRDR
jgi:hypothetical protein